MRTIKVTGRGNLSIKPDITCIFVTLSEAFPEYSDAIKRSTEDTERLKELLLPFGFKREDLKTLSFDVDTEFEGYTEDGVYKQRRTGYRYTHIIKLSFESDNDRLGQILSALSGSSLDPGFMLSYTVKDKEAARNELIGKAVSDSMAKAKALTDAAGVKLGDIQSIDYSWSGSELEIRPMNRAMMAKCDSFGADAGCAPDVVPDDITITDTVTVIWEIE